ncbi:MAG: hypothetical protein ACTSPQ_16210 [Candidatus Helarchaeota archaeon]
MTDWWYFYYSRGKLDKEKFEPSDFALDHDKETPDFKNLKYEPMICHHQIGENIQIGSVIVLTTTVGNKNKNRYITGYFVVKSLGELQNHPKHNKKIYNPLYMDPENSLLLLDNPIKIDKEWVDLLYPGEYDKNSQEKKLLQFISPKTRNSKLKEHQKSLIIKELKQRYKQGAKNYLGKNYQFEANPNLNTKNSQCNCK